MLQEMLTISLFLMPDTTFMKILSFSRQSLSGTLYTLSFEIHKILVFSKKYS